jgi:hypothetical protein
MFDTKIHLHSSMATTSLPKRRTWHVEGDQRGETIRCLKGVVWVTQESDPQDYILEAGDTFRVTRRGAVVAQAMRDAQFQYSLHTSSSALGRGTHTARA